MARLIDMLSPRGDVDYVKMDVERAERFLLHGSAEWAALGRCVQVG